MITFVPGEIVPKLVLLLQCVLGNMLVLTDYDSIGKREAWKITDPDKLIAK